MNEMLKTDGLRFLLVSNTGTLLDAFRSQAKAKGGDWLGIESKLLVAMNTIKPTPISFQGSEFVLVNLAMMDNLPVARRIFERMLAEERWAACSSASCRNFCPIFRNVTLMQANLARVVERVFLAYRRMYEYSSRLTLRQISAHMAYMITSGLEYEDIAKMAQQVKPPFMLEFMFFNRFFGDNGKETDHPALQLKAIRAVRKQEYGSRFSPIWERQLWLRSRGQSFHLNAAKAPDDFEKIRQYGAEVLLDGAISSAVARNQVRRAVFFLHDFNSTEGDEFIHAFLRSNMLLDFVRWQEIDSENLSLPKLGSLRKRIVHVLQEHFTGIRLPEGASSDSYIYVTLSRHSNDVRQSAQLVLARYPEDSFRIVLRTIPNPAGGRRRELVLEGFQNNDELNLALPLPFLDYVMLRNRGEVGQALQASYVDRLETFKGLLIRRANRQRTDEIMLVRLRTNHTFRRQIFAVSKGRLEVNDA